MKRSRVVYKNIAFVIISLFFITLVLLNVSISDALTSLATIGLKTFLLCFAIHFFIYLFRSLSMALILKKEIPFPYLFNAHLIHNFYMNIIPASMGELTLPILLEKYVPKSRSFSILIVTRVFTLLIFLILFLISFLSLFNQFSLITINDKFLFYILLLIGAIISFALLLLIRKVRDIPLLRKFLTNIVTLIDRIRYVVVNELNLSTIGSIVLVTVVYILFLALFYYVILQRLGIELNIIELFFVMSFQVAILILPIKTFGSFGTTEGAWLLGLMALGIESNFALKSGFIIHIINLSSAGIYFLIGLAVKQYLDKRISLNENNS